MTDSTTTCHQTDPAELLAATAELLHQSASAAWARAELEGPFGPTYSLAHNLHLAAALAANLVPQSADVLPLPEFTISPSDTAAALTLAQHLIGMVPPEVLPREAIPLLAMLGDLLRQVGS